MKFPIRVVVNENGHRRELVKITRSSDGGLTLSHREIQLESDDLPDELPAKGEISNHISIHATLKSDTINTIKKTIVSASKRLPPTYHHTSAIKSHNQYAPVYARRYASQTRDYPEYRKTGGTILDLGGYNTEFFSLDLGVFVGPAGLDLTPDHRGLDTNVQIFDSAQFRIAILWSYLTIPSHRIGTMLFKKTYGDESTRDEDVADPGFPPGECFSTFRMARDMLFDELLRLAARDGIPNDQIEFMARTAAYWRHGRGKGDATHVIGPNYRKTADNSPMLYKLKHPAEPVQA